MRDLLLGRHPKDFDIATDARPEEVRALFNNSRLIGRRFRLAHVRFGRDIIEVATFRGGQDQQQASEHRQVAETSGRILRDNVYGSLEEDIWRRDSRPMRSITTLRIFQSMTLRAALAIFAPVSYG